MERKILRRHPLISGIKYADAREVSRLGMINREMETQRIKYEKR